MISVVVCSVNDEYFFKLSDNIKNSIGVTYEIIRIDNKKSKYGIAKAYNIGAKKAIFPYLCFVHEDVKFITEGWGRIAINHIITAENVGVVGLAGSIYKSRSLSSWWQPTINDVEPKRFNIIQYYKHSDKEFEHLISNPFNEVSSNVASLDGVFLFVEYSTWKQCQFDEHDIISFHGYDLDFTLNVGKGKRNIVVYDILLEHYSEGSNDKDWFLSNILVHKKFRYLLPVRTTKEIDGSIIKKADVFYLKHNIKLIKKYKLSFKELLVCYRYILSECFSIIGV